MCQSKYFSTLIENIFSIRSFNSDKTEESTCARFNSKALSKCCPARLLFALGIASDFSDALGSLITIRKKKMNNFENVETKKDRVSVYIVDVSVEEDEVIF